MLLNMICVGHLPSELQCPRFNSQQMMPKAFRRREKLGSLKDSSVAVIRT
jgi:hypothetical protein